MRFCILWIVLGAALLRFYCLGCQPLWLDEAADASFAVRPFWNCVFAEHVHPPLYRGLLHWTTLAAGSSAEALRLLPAVFGTLSVPAVAALAAELFPETEIAIALLAATSPFLIFYSQENRNYSLFILLSIVSTWLFLRFRRTESGLSLYSAVSILLLYTHYLSVFVLLAHEIVYWRDGKKSIRGWLLSRSVAAAAFAPWLLWAARHYYGESRLFLSPIALIPVALLRFLLGYGIAASDASRLAQPWHVRAMH